MALGGPRLADLLNTLFTSNAMDLTCFYMNGMLKPSWNSISGRTYHLEWKQQFSDTSWNNLADITPTANSVWFYDVAIQTQRFYRVLQ